MKISINILFSTFIICIASLLPISCYEKIDFNNPLDANNSLNAPNDLEIAHMSEDSLILKWNDNITYTNHDQARAVDIIIEQSTDNINFLSIDTVNGYGSECILHHIFQTNKNYYFRIYTKVESKISRESNTITGKIPFMGPSQLTLMSMTTTQINLKWVNNSDLTKEFIVEMSKDDSEFDSVAAVSKDSVNFLLKGNFDSTTVYIFRVIAKSKYNQSPYSNSVGTSLKGNTYLGLSFSYVEGGSFIMGNSNHIVTLSSFGIGKYEITQQVWREVVIWKQNHGGTDLNESPSYFKGDSLPVESVTWNEVTKWISYLNEKEFPNKYRLPTEAEWEFSARGANKSMGYLFSGSDDCYKVAWTGWDFVNKTASVGKKFPNELGTYDMSGNVAEWCLDWFGSSFPQNPETNPTGPATGRYKVIRGGYYNADPYLCTVSARMWGYWNDALGGLDQALKTIGFRLVKEK
jgi:formylglycine-generating enzyme required for sulfatase activity